MIKTVPDFLAVALPLELMETTDLLEELHLIFCLVPVILNWKDFPLVMKPVLLDNLGVSTINLHLYTVRPFCAVMVTFPFFLAVTMPEEVTVAIFLFEVFHIVSTFGQMKGILLNLFMCTFQKDVLLLPLQNSG